LSNKGLFFATEGTFSGYVYTPGKAGSHTIKHVIRDSFCPDSVTMPLQINTLPRFTLGKDTVVCDNQSLALFVTSAGTISWENASTSNPRPIFAAGTYWAEVDNSGCKWRDTIKVGYQTTPEASLPGDTLICKGSLIVLKQVWPSANITWSTGSNDTQIYISSPGVYSVSVSNSCGTASDFMEVKVSDGFCDVFIPTAFTPNGDDRNEYFEIQGRDIQPVLLQIFNRWGEIIFDSERTGEYRWYGDANGQPCMEGNYPFIYRYEQKVGDRIRRQTVKGAVMILK
jgi:gliding motility-associated-like protein